MQSTFAQLPFLGYIWNAYKENTATGWWYKMVNSATRGNWCIDNAANSVLSLSTCNLALLVSQTRESTLNSSEGTLGKSTKSFLTVFFNKHLILTLFRVRLAPDAVLQFISTDGLNNYIDLFASASKMFLVPNLQICFVKNDFWL